MHDRQQRRCRCSVCRKALSARKGTPFSRLRKPRDLVVTVLTLRASGCPWGALVQACGLAEETVQHWLRRAGAHGEQVHPALVEPPRELGEVQGEEIRVTLRHQVVAWRALAWQPTTRLGLGGALSPRYGLADAITRAGQTLRFVSPVPVCDRRPEHLWDAHQSCFSRARAAH